MGTFVPLSLFFSSIKALQKCYNYYYYCFSLMVFTIIISIVGMVTVVITVYTTCSLHNNSFIFCPICFYVNIFV